MTFSFEMLQNDTMLIEETLQNWAKDLDDPLNNFDVPALLSQSMGHSLLAGGKRLRPLLVLHGAKASQPKWSRETLWSHCRFAAIAIEMIHTYSLIHDDLPALDNDDLRRGKPTCHISFGEAQAILAGDGLLTDAFNLLAQAPIQPHLQVLELARAAGSRGMVAGQVDDLAAENLPSTEINLGRIHTRKTARLMTAACRLGCLSVNGQNQDLHHLTEYGLALGLAFQIADDVLDAIAEPERAGKNLGRDEIQNKITYLTQLGLEGAKKEARKFADKACQHAEHLPGNQETLIGLAQFSAQRLF